LKAKWFADDLHDHSTSILQRARLKGRELMAKNILLYAFAFVFTKRKKTTSTDPNSTRLTKGFIMEFLPSDRDLPTASFRGCTLIIPAVSLGNVGQLAVDLIIETHPECTRVGRLAHAAVLPCAGMNGFAPRISGPTFALELFAVPSSNLLILQQRSSVAPGLQQAFAEDLAAWARGLGIGRVWVLGSLDARFRHGAQLQSETPLRSWMPESSSKEGEEELQRACQAADAPALEPEYEAEGKPLSDRLTPPWPLLRACGSKGLLCAALLVFVIEGDNVMDAVTLANAMGRAVPAVSPPQDKQEGKAALNGGGIGRQSLGWRQPASWHYAFGTGPPVGL
jgi:proteasome assembly chaperone 2